VRAFGDDLDAARLPDLRKLHQSGARLSDVTASWLPEVLPRGAAGKIDFPALMWSGG
jgi:hypothetical protein